MRFIGTDLKELNTVGRGRCALKKTTTHTHTQRNKITNKMAILFSGESYTLRNQTTRFRINNGHLPC